MRIKREFKHLASFLEQWTELDVMYFIRGGALLFLAQAVLVVTGLLLTIGFARLATKEAFGQFQFFIAVLGMLSILAMPGANTAVLLGSSQNKGGVLYQGIRFKLKWCILGIFGLLVTAGYFYLKHEPRYAGVWPAFLVAILFFPILYTLDIVQAFFAGQRKFSYNCISQIGIEGGSALAALAVLFFTKNLVVIIGVYLLVQALGDSVAFLVARRQVKNNKTDADFYSYSVHLTIINLIPYIKTFFDKIIVTFFLGFAATAVYSIAASIGEQLYAVSKTVGSLVFPKIAEKRRNIYSEVRRRTFKLFLFFAVVAGIAVFLSPFLIPFFFSEQYSSSIIFAQFLLVAGIPRAVAFVLTRVLEVQRSKKKLYKINVVYAGTEIAAMVVLVPLYGLYGLVWAKAVSQLVYFVMAWRSLH